MQFHGAVENIRVSVIPPIWPELRRLTSSLRHFITPVGSEGHCSVQPSIAADLDLLITGDPEQPANEFAATHMNQCASCREYVEAGQLMRRRLRLAIKGR